MKTIRIGGYAGDEPERMANDEFKRHLAYRWVSAGNRMPCQPPDHGEPDPGTSEEELFTRFTDFCWEETERIFAAKWHNSLVDLVNAETAARQAAEAALERVEARWKDLETAPAWHAAHHRYVLAVRDARKALDALGEAAAERDKAAAVGQPIGRGWELYEAAVPAGERVPPSWTDWVETTRMEFDEKARERRDIVAETLGRADG